MRTTDIPGIGSDTFHADMHSTESFWQRMKVGGIEGKMDMPVIDSASEKGESLVFVPNFERLKFFYAHQIGAS